MMEYERFQMRKGGTGIDIGRVWWIFSTFLRESREGGIFEDG